MSLLLGIDLGSTSIKAVAYDLQGNAVALASRPTVVHRPHPEHPTWAIAKPEEVWACAADSVAEVVAKIGDAKRIKALAVTGQGMDGVPIDSAGRVIYPFISWHCPRTTPQQKWWLENIGAEKTFAITGNPVWACNPALRLLWMKENEGEILAKTTKWLLIEDFLNFMLTGEKVTDYTMASNTLLFDQRKQVYSPELLERSGIDRGLLCDAKPSGTIIGQVNRAAADRTGLAAGTPVVLGGHDFLCGCLPVGAFEPGVVLDVCGTWEIVVTAIAQPVLTDAVREMGWWVDSHVARGVWSAMGSAVAADMLEWFRKLFGYEEAQKAKTQGGVDWD